MRVRPDIALEPTAVGVFRSAVAVRALRWLWLSLFR